MSESQDLLAGKFLKMGYQCDGISPADELGLMCAYDIWATQKPTKKDEAEYAEYRKKMDKKYRKHLKKKGK